MGTAELPLGRAGSEEQNVYTWVTTLFTGLSCFGLVYYIRWMRGQVAAASG